MGVRHESGSQGDSTAKRQASERICTQGQTAFCGAGWHSAAEWHSAFPSLDGAVRRTGTRHKEAGCQPAAGCHPALHDIGDSTFMSRTHI